jgi:prepilin-type N-terminal cleavage/methylation domain-containing protein
MPNSSGFTLVEILVVVAIMTAISAIVVPVSIDYQQRNDLDISQTIFAQGIRRAQQISMYGEYDSQWGVIVIPGDIIIFKGSNYATRDINYDEKYDISSGVSLSGQLEYDFVKITGLPSQTGTVIFMDGSYQKQVSINAKGIVNY